MTGGWKAGSHLITSHRVCPSAGSVPVCKVEGREQHCLGTRGDGSSSSSATSLLTVGSGKSLHLSEPQASCLLKGKSQRRLPQGYFQH